MAFRSVFTIAAVSALLMPATVFAQADEHRIGGKAISADQVAEVQAHCDALRKGEKQSPVAQAATGKPNTAAATEAAADTAVALSSDLWIDNGDRIDVQKLSLELCDEGNFSLSPK